MGCKNEMTRNLLAQVPGRENHHANAVGNANIAQRKTKRHNSDAPLPMSPDWKGGAA